MAIIKDNILDWSDVETIYAALNQARKKFGITEVTIPSNTDTLVPTEEVTTLKTLIETMKSNKYVGDNASTSSVPTPNKGDIIKPTPMTGLKSIIDNVNNICAHDGSYHYGNYGYDSTNYGYDSSDHSSNYGWNSGNYGWNSGNYSYNNSNVVYNSACVTIRR